MFTDRQYASEDDRQMCGTGEMYAIGEELRRNSKEIVFEASCFRKYVATEEMPNTAENGVLE